MLKKANKNTQRKKQASNYKFCGTSVSSKTVLLPFFEAGKMRFNENEPSLVF